MDGYQGERPSSDGCGGLGFGGRHVLVIDDEEDFLEAIALVLSGLSLEVTGVPNGGAALAALRAQHFDLVITDLRMPGMSGDDTITALRTIDAKVPIVLTTGSSLDEATRCQARGARELLRKPFNMAELIGVVTRALDETRPV
jgi:CheY-like chemotaxis protein